MKSTTMLTLFELAGPGFGADTVNLVGVPVDEGDPGPLVVAVAAVGFVEPGSDHRRGVVANASVKPLTSRPANASTCRLPTRTPGGPGQWPLLRRQSSHEPPPPRSGDVAHGSTSSPTGNTASAGCRSARPRPR